MMTLNAQVAIGKSTVTNSSTILDFDNSATNKKGIILPAVDNLSKALPGTAAHNHGTFLFDKSDNVVKMYENNTWKPLSDAGSKTAIESNAALELPDNQGVIIGSDTSNALGVLVLESSNKAMVLPWVANPHSTVVNPYPGMICYDTVSRSLAVFDGDVWSYWR